MAKVARFLVAILLLFGGCILGFYMLIKNGYLLQVPTTEKIESFKLPQASEIYTSDSVLLGKIYLEKRKCITYDELSEDLINCLIATEDSRYYEHNGVDLIGLMRVLVKTFLFSEKSGGGSTITQQLVKNRYPRASFDTDFLVFHKIREWFTAMKMEQLYSKNDILVDYLNTVPFGHNCFGIHTAANYYFNKGPKELAVHEAATLIGLLKATTIYDPERNPEVCLERRNLVLRTMQMQGYLSEKKFKSALKENLNLASLERKAPTIAPFFLAHVKSKIEEVILEENEYGSNINPYTDGLKIYTTLDSRIQKKAENALQIHLDSLQKQFDIEWSEERWRNEKDKLIQLLQLKQYNGYEQVCKALKNEIEFSPEIKALLTAMKSDLTRLHAGFTCIKNSGEVLAWVGGRDFSYSQYDHVKSTRQVGSVFKPIVYVTAVDQGVNICNYFKNNRQSYSQFDDWQPRNASNNYNGEYTMKGALTYSLNVISVQVLFRAGLLDVLNVARQMGITTNIPEVPSISLGTPDISLYEIVNAYTCFPNNGKRLHTKYLKSIISNKGGLLYEEEALKVKEIFSGNVAAIMTNMMESVVNNGTSRAIRSEFELRGPIAGKTGTTQNQSDGWFVGYTPQFTAGAWVGADSPTIHFESLKKGSGSKTALPIWALFVRSLQNDPAFSHLFQGKFRRPSRRSLNCLNQALYRES